MVYCCLIVTCESEVNYLINSGNVLSDHGDRCFVSFVHTTLRFNISMVCRTMQCRCFHLVIGWHSEKQQPMSYVCFPRMFWVRRFRLFFHLSPEIVHVLYDQEGEILVHYQ